MQRVCARFKMQTFLYFYVLFAYSLGNYSTSAVNLIIDSKIEPASIRCPTKYDAIRRDRINNDAVDSKLEVKFHCSLFYDGFKRTTNYIRYHVSMIPLFNSSIVGCPNLDSCLSLYLRHIPPDDFVEVQIKSNVSCLYTMLPFKYELRQLSTIIDSGLMDVYVAHPPPTPGHLKFKHREKLFIEGAINPVCKSDLLSVSYYMQHEATSPNCTQSHESSCNVIPSGTQFLVSCLVNSTCEGQSACDVQYSAFVYGENRFKMESETSPRFNKMLALANARSMSLKVKHVSHAKLTLTFQKPVKCNSSISHFQYQITYSKVTEQTKNDWPSVIDKSCERELTCTHDITGLDSNTHYNICVSYLASFDYLATFSVPQCVSASTGVLPCQAPEILNVKSVVNDRKTCNAIITWTPIDLNCWNGGTFPHYSVKLYYERNNKYMLAENISKNQSSIELFHLAYDDYMLTLQSCNVYGCSITINYRLLLRYNHAEENTGPSSTQKITENILICVFSLLFVGVVSILYCVLKRRKQFERFRGRLRTNDIRLVTTQGDVNESQLKDTADPLLSHDPTAVQHAIPLHSTLV